MATSLKTKINTFLRTEKTKRDALQTLLVECIAHAKQHDNAFDNLSTLMRGLIQLKSRNADAIRAYILEHVSGVQWTKIKHKTGKQEHTFKRVNKDTPVTYVEITYPWFNHSKNQAVNTNKPLNVIARAKSLLTVLTKGMEDHNIEKGQEQPAKELIDSLNAIIQHGTEKPVIKASGPVAKAPKRAKGEKRLSAVAKA